jgi:single-strand DNA-binding protein
VANNTSVKTRDGYREEPSWFDWYAFGKTAEVLSRYVQKGDRILLSGRAKQSRWQDQNGKTQSRVEFIVSTYQFLEARRAAPDKTASAAMYGGEPHEPGDDMPF